MNTILREQKKASVSQMVHLISFRLQTEEWEIEGRYSDVKKLVNGCTEIEKKETKPPKLRINGILVDLNLEEQLMLTQAIHALLTKQLIGESYKKIHPSDAAELDEILEETEPDDDKRTKTIELVERCSPMSESAKKRKRVSDTVVRLRRSQIREG